MKFEMTEDQQAISELAESVFRDQVPDDRYLSLKDGFDTGLWQGALADTGLIGVMSPEAYGGADLGFLTACFMLKSMGTVLAHVPLVPTILVAEILKQTDMADDVSAAIRGETHFAIAFDSGLSLENGRIAGVLPQIPFASGARWLAVKAGGKLVLIDLKADGVNLTPQRLTNGLPCSALEADTQAVYICEDVLANRIWQMQQTATAFVQLGVTEEALKRTVAYANERQQFGKPISSFQAVTHRLADGYIDVESLRSIAEGAAWAIEDGQDAAIEAASAYWWACEAGHRVTHSAQHIHAGIGADITYPIHRYFLWAKQLEFSLGGAPSALEAAGEILLAQPGAGVKI